MTLQNRKDDLKTIALNNYSNGGQIYKLINQGYLDHIIGLISDDKTITNSRSIVKKGYLTGNEQFIDIFAELLFYFESNFITLQHKEWHIANVLENRTPRFLLCKKYWGNNKFIPYYKNNMIKLFVRNLYDNIKYIYDDYKDFFKKLNISTSMSINNSKDLDILFEFMKELVWCNCIDNQFSFDYIFSNYKFRIKDLQQKHKKNKTEADNITHRNYITHWDMLISQYLLNIEYIKKLLK